MAFFEALKRLLSHASHADAPDEARQRIRAAWGFEDEEAPDAAAEKNREGPGATDYDRSRWAKRLRKVLDELPASEPHWQELTEAAQALGFEPEWTAEIQRAEFTFLVRSAVADRVVSEEEHRKLDLARKLIGISESEAEQILQAVTAEAEAFFGTPVQDEA